MYLKLGNRYADVVCISDRAGLEEGNEEFVIATLWYGYTIDSSVKITPGSKQQTHLIKKERREMQIRTSENIPPRPINSLKSAARLSPAPSSSIRELQSSFPVQTNTCSAYGAIVPFKFFE